MLAAHGGRNWVLLVPAPGEAGMTPSSPGAHWHRGPESPRKLRAAGVRPGSSGTAGEVGQGPGTMVLRAEGHGEPGEGQGGRVRASAEGQRCHCCSGCW